MPKSVTNRTREIADLAKELPDSALQELLDFAKFLKVKEHGF